MAKAESCFVHSGGSFIHEGVVRHRNATPVNAIRKLKSLVNAEFVAFWVVFCSDKSVAFLANH